jgi:hypothetical protein
VVEAEEEAAADLHQLKDHQQVAKAAADVKKLYALNNP